MTSNVFNVEEDRLWIYRKDPKKMKHTHMAFV